jgi:hypothetical protein
VLFQANSPLAASETQIRSVGVVLDGKARSTTVMVLEASRSAPHFCGQVTQYDHVEIWRGRLIDYVMTPEQRRLFVKTQGDLKAAVSKKRKEQHLAREAKKVKQQN